MKVPKALVRAKERAEPIVKNFEWTWTTAACSPRVRLLQRHHDGGDPLVLGSTSRSRSSAGEAVRHLGLAPDGPDFVAAKLAVGPFVTVSLIGAIMQNWRRRLRGWAPPIVQPAVPVRET